MKNTRVCPKCSGTGILIIKGNIGPYGVGNNIPAGLSYAKVDRYLCTSCGYSEEWVNSEDIGRLVKKYGKK